MLNKDKRSLALILALGDGCLYYHKSSSGIYGGIAIEHGIKQADYQAWKAKLLSHIFEKEVKVRVSKGGQAVQVSVVKKRLRAWRKHFYRDGKKDRLRMLAHIRHPILAMAVWLMDDGYNLTCGGLRLYSCATLDDDQPKLLEWVQAHFGVMGAIKVMKSKGKKPQLYLRWNQAESLVIWAKVREFILTFKSMQYKFRYTEKAYQSKGLLLTGAQSIEPKI